MRKILIYISLLLGTFGCDEVFDKDIADEKVSLFAPANNTEIIASGDTAILFKWNELEGAKNYQIQIVSPSFQAPVLALTDSLVTKTQFSTSLSAGKYQWTVTAINNTAKAYADTFSITISPVVSETP